MQINRENIDNIQLDIRDDAGDLFPFASGKVIVTLKFRKRVLSIYQ